MKSRKRLFGFLAGCFMLVLCALLLWHFAFKNSQGGTEKLSALGVDSKAEKTVKTLRFASSIYAGWMPWYYAHETGLMEQTAAARGWKVDFVPGEYLTTIGQFGSGSVDAVTMTAMDAVVSLAGSRMSASAVLIGSYSNGNDAILIPESSSEFTPGAEIYLELNSVSHYLWLRFVDRFPEFFRSQPIQTAENSILPKISRLRSGAVATWNPYVTNIVDAGLGKVIFDSSAIPREIADLLVINRERLKEHPETAAILLETWFRVMEKLRDNPEEVIAEMARLSEASPESFQRQLQATLFAVDPKRAEEFFEDRQMQIVADRIQSGFLAEEQKPFAVSFPWHSKDNAILRFDPSYLR